MDVSTFCRQQLSFLLSGMMFLKRKGKRLVDD